MTAATYAQALSDVKARVTNSRSSFQAGMAILPKVRRDGMYALYAFCREVDDIADDSLTLADAAKGLAMWRRRIADLFRGKTSDTITTTLLPAVKEFGLVEEDFQAIIDGMDMDAAVICAPDDLTLDLYCDRVASAVGRVSVRIFGDASEQAMQVAYHLGRALQLTNILRDLAEDATRGRLYLPHELLQKCGIRSREPMHVLREIRLPEVCRLLALRVKAHFAEADKAMGLCLPWAMKPARIMRGYYGAIFRRLLAADWQDLSVRVRVPGWQKIWLLLRYGAF